MYLSEKELKDLEDRQHLRKMQREAAHKALERAMRMASPIYDLKQFVEYLDTRLIDIERENEWLRNELEQTKNALMKLASNASSST